MTDHDVIIYTSTNCSECEKVMEKMNSLGVDYIEKSVSNNEDYLKELQNRGIFGTPATFIDNHTVLGFQESKLKYELSLVNSHDFYFRNIYEGYDKK